MSKIEKFEDMKVWQTARELCKMIHQYSAMDSFSRDFKLVGQISGASGSVMDNIAEGFERDGSREFVQFLSIAKGSSGEVRSQLYRAFDNNYISQKEFEVASEKYLECSKMLKSLILYLQNSDFKGNKFK